MNIFEEVKIKFIANEIYGILLDETQEWNCFINDEDDKITKVGVISHIGSGEFLLAFAKIGSIILSDGFELDYLRIPVPALLSMKLKENISIQEIDIIFIDFHTKNEYKVKILLKNINF